MIASDSDIKTLNGTIGWCCFWMLWFFFVTGFLFLWKVYDISADIREIRATVVQHAKECHNLDTMEVKNNSGYGIHLPNRWQTYGLKLLKEPHMKPFYVSYSRKNGYYWICERGVEDPRCAISNEGCPRSFVNRIRDALNIVEAAKRSANSHSPKQQKLTKD